MNEARVVAISAGHFPSQPGACVTDMVSRRVIATEHDEAVQYANLLTHILEAQGITVRRIPALPLSQKIMVVNQLPTPVCAVEIHFNAAVDAHGQQVGQGCESLYDPHSTAGKALATEIQTRLAPLFQPDRGIKPGWYRMDVPGQVDFPGDKEGDEITDAWLRETHCPAAIIEPQFIHHLDSIRDDRQQACIAIAAGIIGWLER